MTTSGLTACSTLSPHVRPQGQNDVYPSQRKAGMTQPRIYTLFAAIILTLAFTAGIARADALVGDPRRCAVNNPRYCAKAAAIATIRSVMAKREGVPKWNDYLNCQPAYGNILRWKCAHIDSQHDSDTITVAFRATSSGWKRVMTVNS